MLVSFLLRHIVITLTMTVSLAAVANSDVIVKTKDFVVTTEDFDSYLLEQDMSDKERRSALSKQGAVQNVVESIYVIKAFAAEAEQNASIDQAEIESLVGSYRARLLMMRQLDFEVAAELDGIDWNALAREDYAANKANYAVPEKVRAAHILISSSSDSEKEAETRVNTVLERLAEGEDFGSLAVEYSDDSGSAGRRGDLGFFTRSEMVKPFADTAFALVEPGEISVPVKTKFGWHIIRLTERKPSRQGEFEKVKPHIISQLKSGLKGSIRADRIADVKSGRVNLGIEVNLPLLKEIQQRYSTDAEANSKK